MRLGRANGAPERLLDPERWVRLRELFDSAAKLAPEARSRFLHEGCAGDIELRGEIESLLRGLGDDDAIGDAVRAAARELGTSTLQPALEVGQEIGHYTILEQLGAGGMGEVYVAEDRLLRRRVALKLLGRWLALDPERSKRLEREARMLASLNHPNIVTIHSVEKEHGFDFLTMELVEGSTLSERLALGPMPLAEAIKVARQLVDAVSAAHEKGIIHRDLKPANITLTADGHVKVLDFGLAKPIEVEAKEMAEQPLTFSPALIEPVSSPGVLIGTAPYMSPEQARGLAVDERTDVWAFGCVLYEMLSGERAFSGTTAADVIGAVIKGEPRWDAVPESTPPTLRRLLRRCLEKDPAQRLHVMAEARRTLEDAWTEAGDAITAAKPRGARLARGPVLIAVLFTTALGLAAVGLRGWLPFSPGPMSALRSPRGVRDATEHPRLVVLPFRNLGPAADELFAEGTTDAITARLAKLQGLEVISLQTSALYRSTDKTPRQIGAELGVGYILEGTLQRERPSDPGSRVRIIPRLIQVSDNGQLWADTYDAEFKGLFRVQSQIAERVAAALNVVLLEREHRWMAARYTGSPEAFELFTRAKQYDPTNPHMNRVGEELLERAVALDPEFALAQARLARVHLSAFFHGIDPSQERLAKAKRAIDEALRIEPDLPEGHLALGYYYYQGYRDYEKALQEFEVARKDLPNETALLLARRTSGDGKAGSTNQLRISKQRLPSIRVGPSCSTKSAPPS